MCTGDCGRQGREGRKGSEAGSGWDKVGQDIQGRGWGRDRAVGSVSYMRNPRWIGGKDKGSPRGVHKVPDPRCLKGCVGKKRMGIGMGKDGWQQ